jgi:RNA polymerase sigma-70 factor, ECF subfamily
VTVLPPDAELIARVVAADDARAFEQLVRRYQAVVRGFLRRLCADAAAADDLAQETFLKAYQRLAQFRGGAKLSTWLIAIAYNEFLQSRRRGAQRRRLAAALRQEPGHWTREETPEVHDLPKLLAWLEEDERVVMVLSYAHEFSHREIAIVMGLPVGTVKSKLTRGRQRILARLGTTEVQDA